MSDSDSSLKDVAKANRREVPRYDLIAQADVAEPASGLRIAGRISELSRKGCYVDVLNTLPGDTLVEVKISRDRGTFTSPGKIIYTQESMGMGVVFLNTAPDQLKVLEAWLAELTPH